MPGCIKLLEKNQPVQPDDVTPNPVHPPSAQHLRQVLRHLRPCALSTPPFRIPRQAQLRLSVPLQGLHQGNELLHNDGYDNVRRRGGQQRRGAVQSPDDTAPQGESPCQPGMRDWPRPSGGRAPWFTWLPFAHVLPSPTQTSRNAVNMAKALLKTGLLACPCLMDEDRNNNCKLKNILREIVNGQNR